jgi:hypothetical protein
MIRAEAVPAVRTKTSNKVPINTILFIFFTSSVILTQRIKTPYFSLCAKHLYLLTYSLSFLFMTLSASKNLSMMKALEGHFLKAPSCTLQYPYGPRLYNASG